MKIGFENVTGAGLLQALIHFAASSLKEAEHTWLCMCHRPLAGFPFEIGFLR